MLSLNWGYSFLAITDQEGQQEVARKGVTVNAIAPGFVRTDMTADIDEAELKKQIPAGRFCEPAEVADLAMFLISEQASYITGEVISITGGLYT